MSMWTRNQSQDGTIRSCSGVGCSHRRTAGSGSLGGPGARSPYRWTSWRKPENASWPVTFCSMIAGTSDSMTRSVAPSRQLPWRRQASTSGAGGSKPVRVVVGAEHAGQLVQHPGGAGPPGGGVDDPVGGSGGDPEAGGALGRADAAPDRPVGGAPEGGVAAAAPVRGQDGHDRAGPVRAPLTGERRLGAGARSPGVPEVMAAEYVGAPGHNGPHAARPPRLRVLRGRRHLLPAWPSAT